MPPSASAFICSRVYKVQLLHSPWVASVYDHSFLSVRRRQRSACWRSASLTSTSSASASSSSQSSATSVEGVAAGGLQEGEGPPGWRGTQKGVVNGRACCCGGGYGPAIASSGGSGGGRAGAHMYAVQLLLGGRAARGLAARAALPVRRERGGAGSQEYKVLSPFYQLAQTNQNTVLCFIQCFASVLWMIRCVSFGATSCPVCPTVAKQCDASRTPDSLTSPFMLHAIHHPAINAAAPSCCTLFWKSAVAEFMRRLCVLCSRVALQEVGRPVGCAAGLTLTAVPLAGIGYLPALCGTFLSEALAFCAGGRGRGSWAARRT